MCVRAKKSLASRRRSLISFQSFDWEREREREKKRETFLDIRPERERERWRNIVPYVTNSIVFVLVVTNQLDAWTGSIFIHDCLRNVSVALLCFSQLVTGKMIVFIPCPWLEDLELLRHVVMNAISFCCESSLFPCPTDSRWEKKPVFSSILEELKQQFNQSCPTLPLIDDRPIEIGEFFV